jgi:lysophospholipase L1-like esterase
MKIRAALLYLVIIVGTVLVAEVLARAYGWTPSRDDYTADRLGQWRYYHAAGGSGDLMPSQDGHWVIWFHRPYHVQTNSVGLRNAAELSGDGFRILAIGDSQTFGAYNVNEDTWPAWTENGLNLRAKQAGRFQVLNAGISGYTISDELAYLKDKGAALQPKLVLLAVIENDVTDLRKDLAGTPQRPKDGAMSSMQIALRALGRSSALVSFAEHVKTGMQFQATGVDIRRGEGDRPAPSEAPPDEAVLERRYAELFRETAGLLKAKSIPFAVFYIPSAETLDGGAKPTVEPVVRRLAEETGTPYLDVTPILQRQPDPAQRLYLLQKDPKTGQLTGNGHLSREGHAAVAGAVVQWLTEAKLVPTP